jgi:uncharacterized protein (TIGR02217 family)
MSFIDLYLPPEIPGYPCASVPRTKTNILMTSGGRESRNIEWEHPLHRFILPEAAGREWSVVETLKKHWLVTSGPALSFPWRDPLDFASCDLVRPNVVPVVSLTDQPLGTGDGINEIFQLRKTYTRGAFSYTRDIHLPVLSSLLIAADGVLVSPTTYTVSRPGGVVTFNDPPANGVVLTAGFLFDCEVRFESDDQLESILRTYQVGGFADITLIEVRAC